MASRKQRGPLVLLLALLVAMVVTHLLVPWLRVVRFPWNLLGLPPLAAGPGISAAGEHAFRR